MTAAPQHDRPTALDDLVVLDLTRVRAGPTCCRVFADFGANVIKIEAPEGADGGAGASGPRHGYDMLNLHRNKRSLCIDLKNPQGHALFMRMVKSADIVVENFRPDVKERLKIAYDDLSSVNPGIILASISGFGQTGPYAKRAGFDQIAQGMGGLMSVTGHPGEGPMRAGTAVADTSSGLYAAIGILVALQERARSGLGQWVHTSLLEAQIALLDFQAARYLVDGEVPAQAGNDHPYCTPMGVVATLDGYMNLGVGSDKQWQRLCEAIGHPEWAADEKFAANAGRTKRRSEVWDMLTPIFAQKTTAAWIDLLEPAGVPAGPIHKIDAMFDDAQVKELGMAAPSRHHSRGDIRLVAQPVTLSRTPHAICRASPDPGEHSREILSEFGLRDDEISTLRADGVI